MPYCFVIFSFEPEFIRIASMHLGNGELVRSADSIDKLRDAFERDYINLFLVDSRMADGVYFTALEKASFFPARVNTFLITVHNDGLYVDGNLISNPASYFKERV